MSVATVEIPCPFCEQPQLLCCDVPETEIKNRYTNVTCQDCSSAWAVRVCDGCNSIAEYGLQTLLYDLTGKQDHPQTEKIAFCRSHLPQLHAVQHIVQ